MGTCPPEDRDDARHAFWPAQLIPDDICSIFKKDFSFLDSLKRHSASQDACVMYFNIQQVAWINMQADTVSWSEGVNRGFANVADSHPKLARALREVNDLCAHLSRYPLNWWNEPQSDISARENITDTQKKNETSPPEGIHPHSDTIPLAPPPNPYSNTASARAMTLESRPEYLNYETIKKNVYSRKAQRRVRFCSTSEPSRCFCLVTKKKKGCTDLKCPAHHTTVPIVKNVATNRLTDVLNRN